MRQAARVLAVVLGCLACAACQDTDLRTYIANIQSPVYTGGYYYNGSRSIACYWQGTLRTDLPDGPGTLNSGASAAVVSGGTVYSAGFYLSGQATPCYWVGANTPTPLSGPSGTTSGFAQSIYVTGSTILTAGSNYTNTPTAHNQACQWVVATRTDLNGNGILGTGWSDSYAYSISSWGGAIYVAGYWHSIAPARNYACYWGSGNLFTLPDGSGANASRASSIFVSNGTVYTAGYYGTVSTVVPCYWTGYLSSPTVLPGIGTYAAWAYSIFVSGGHVYVAGNAYNGSIYVPCYWMDGVMTLLPIPASAGSNNYALGITVLNGTIYTAGYYNNGSYNVGCYWAGTTRTNFPADVNNSVIVNSIFAQ